MTQPPHHGWQPPDPDQPGAAEGWRHRPAPPEPRPDQAAQQTGHRHPVPPQPAARPPHPGPPMPPPAVPPGNQYAPMPSRGSWPMPQPPRQVAPPVPVADPPRDDPTPALPPLPHLPPAPGPQGRAPRLATAGRIPEDLPFVIRPRASRWLLLFVVPLVLLLAPTVYLFVSGRFATALLVLVITTAAYVVGFGFRIFTQVTGGPLLAADRSGVWVRAQKWPVKAMQVPWELVAEIRPKRWFVEHVLCVIPRDERVGKLNEAWSAIDQARTTAFFGVPLTASIAFGDRSPTEALQALADLSLGRAKVVGASPSYE